MAIAWTELHNNTHQFSAGEVEINTAFTGNIIAIECDVKPEYQLTHQVIGYLYQYSGVASKGYAIFSGKDAIYLDLPETDRLVFVPTSYLNDTYGLIINYALVGSTISGSNTEALPSNILGLPDRVTALETFETSANTQFTTSASAVTEVQSRLSTVESSVTGLTGDIASHRSRLDTLEADQAVNDSSFIMIDENLTASGTRLATLDSRLTTVESALITANTAIASKANESDLTALTTRVAAIETGESTGGSSGSSSTGYKQLSDHLSVPLVFYWDDSLAICADYVSKQNFGFTGTKPERVLVDNTSGLQFLGASSGHFTIPDSSALDITGNLAYFAAIKTGVIPSTNYAGFQGILVKATDVPAGVVLSILGSNFYASFENDSGTSFNIASSVTVESNTDYLVIIWRDGANCYLSVNGVVDSISTFTGSVNTTSGLPLRIGSGASVNYGFQGIIKALGITNGALSDADHTYLAGIDFSKFPH